MISLFEESEDDIKNGNLISHETLKQEISSWRAKKIGWTSENEKNNAEVFPM